MFLFRLTKAKRLAVFLLFSLCGVAWYIFHTEESGVQSNQALAQSAINILDPRVCLVVGISDGDTLTLLCEKKQVRVRLAEIDAPESKQPFGRRARNALSELCYNKIADLVALNHDRYNRTIGKVSCDGVDAGSAMVAQGLAWVYIQYATDARLFELENEARERQLGLWASASPTPPWVWRRQAKSAGSEKNQ